MDDLTLTVDLACEPGGPRLADVEAIGRETADRILAIAEQAELLRAPGRPSQPGEPALPPEPGR
nr:hypothetical protein [Streptomyces sp. DSM 41633]